MIAMLNTKNLLALIAISLLGKVVLETIDLADDYGEKVGDDRTLDAKTQATIDLTLNWVVAASIGLLAFPGIISR